MADKKNRIDSDNTHNLVIFGKSKEDTKFSFETIEQEDKIRLANDFNQYGGHYRYSIKLYNDSLASITEVKVKIDYPKFLVIARSYPLTVYIPEAVEEAGNLKSIVEFDELNERSSKEIHLYFTPQSLGHHGELKTIVTYVNNKDFVRVLNSEPVEIRLNEIMIMPKIIPSSRIREFSQKPGMKKAIKSMGIELHSNVNFDIFYNIVEQIFRRNNLQLIAKDPEKRILWYLGADVDLRDDVLIIGQIVSNKVEIITLSKNHTELISFLTLLSNGVKAHIVERGIVNTVDRIHDLECKYCGAVLPYFPEESEEIRCTKCNYEQIVW
ncbi:MAG: hypothetical protein ACW986_02045 [Promethearchaeota archaeon]|jgi:hypothetical protein